MNYLIIFLFIVGLVLWGVVSLVEWLGLAAKQVKAQVSVDTKKDIVERNEEIIRSALDSIYAGDRSYYVENKVRDCIKVIAEKEGCPSVAPSYREWLSQWKRRGGIPEEYLRLSTHLMEVFSARHKELLSAEQRKREDREQEIKNEIAKKGNELFERNKDLIDKFLEITERKVSIIDDYGDENWEVLPDEIKACLKKVGQREGLQINWAAYDKASKRGHYRYGESLPREYDWLKDKLQEVFKEHHENKRSEPSQSIDVSNLSGVEFEIWISKLLKENGYDDVRGTPATGDQGADLIAKKDGKTIIIQAKRYQGTVGNKAVQEVISAVGFYGGDEGWVVTNSTFTPSAKALASKMKIRLVDGKDLSGFRG